MQVIVPAEGSGLDASVSPIFGRCPVYVIVDTETMESESIPNPAQNAAGGAGIQAAQFVLSKNVDAVLTGSLGPNARNVLVADGIEIYNVEADTVRDAVKAFVDGHLRETSIDVPMTEERRQRELSALRSQLAELRKRLADIMTQIENLQKEG
ncbi:MAG: NifB/NifX family molybdenum-iron cluster-binding protein [Chloroflexota bacterium]|nr:NifB/NifX family molybdenum-iron cluster-binding protein [Chloroflexota bacterium]